MFAPFAPKRTLSPFASKTLARQPVEGMGEMLEAEESLGGVLELGKRFGDSLNLSVPLGSLGTAFVLAMLAFAFG